MAERMQEGRPNSAVSRGRSEHRDTSRTHDPPHARKAHRHNDGKRSNSLPPDTRIHSVRRAKSSTSELRVGEAWTEKRAEEYKQGHSLVGKSKSTRAATGDVRHGTESMFLEHSLYHDQDQLSSLVSDGPSSPSLSLSGSRDMSHDTKAQSDTAGFVVSNHSRIRGDGVSHHVISPHHTAAGRGPSHSVNKGLVGRGTAGVPATDRIHVLREEEAQLSSTFSMSSISFAVSLSSQSSAQPVPNPHTRITAAVVPPSRVIGQPDQRTRTLNRNVRIYLPHIKTNVAADC